MTPAEARERYGVATSHADGGEHLTADDGTELVVLESALDGTRRVVHADVCETPRRTLIASALAGFGILIAALTGPLAAALWVALTTPNIAITVGAVGGGVVVAFYLANLILYRTVVNDWVFRLLEWNSHKALVESYRGGSA